MNRRTALQAIAGGLLGAALPVHASMLINPYRFAAASSLLLDDYTAVAAYSLRKLRTAYSGNAIRVRRSSDNAEQDIGFSGNALDESSLTTFVGANDGFVTKLYDQSGGATGDMAQATSGNQYQIVSSGAVVKVGGEPAMLSPNVLGSGYSRSISSHTTTDVYMVLSTSDTQVICVAWGGGFAFQAAIQDGSSSSPTGGGGTPAYRANGTGLTLTRDALHTGLSVGSAVLLTIDGADYSALSTLGVFTYNGGAGWQLDGHFFEMIEFDNSTNQSAIESEVMTHYSIT